MKKRECHCPRGGARLMPFVPTSIRRSLRRRRAGPPAIRPIVARLFAAAALLASAAPALSAQQPAPAPGPAVQPSYQVKPGDILDISVWKEPDLQKQVLVRPDGAFSFPLVGEV